MLVQKPNQSNILSLDMPLGSCSLKSGSGNRRGKRQPQLLVGGKCGLCQCCSRGGKQNKSHKCPLCSVPVPAPCVFPGLLSLVASGTFEG